MSIAHGGYPPARSNFSEAIMVPGTPSECSLSVPQVDFIGTSG
jgi:hypothetical protein